MSFPSFTNRGRISCYSAVQRATPPNTLGSLESLVGHTRLGRIPKTQQWTDIVGQFTDATIPGAMTSPANIAAIAAKALDATEEGLYRATADPGVRYTFFLMTQVALASRTPEWENKLRAYGVEITPNSTVFDLTAQLQDAIDRYVSRTRSGATDLSEIAQKSAGEAITGFTTSDTGKLFEAEIRDAVRPLSTKRGFGELGQRFFGTFVARFLNFYLSRVTAAQLGSAGLRDLVDMSAFNRSLRTHCTQSARIVRDFCGEWYSKTEYQKGINLENTSGFLAVAFEKLRSELKQQKAEM
jgi:hypothetical protein